VWLPRGREWFDLGLVGLMLLGIGTGVVVWAEQWVPSGLAALLVATSPFWVALLEKLRPQGERTGKRAILGMVIGFGGLVLLVAPDLLQTDLQGPYLFGLIALQIGCASWSGGSIYAKQHPTAVSPLVGASIQMLFAGVALTLVGTLLGEWPRVHFNARSFGAFLYLMVFGSIVAYGSYLYALQKLPLSLVSTYSYINPVIAVLLGWLLLAEPLGWRVVIGASVILAGVALVKTNPKKILADRAARREEKEMIHHTSPQVCRVGAD
jgi:drug/metabolite transporter (DMT)-like permease